jgi:hypothetical protein
MSMVLKTSHPAAALVMQNADRGCSSPAHARAQRRSESCDSCGRVIEMQRNTGVFRFVGSIDYLPHGGGAKRPLISSASRQGTSSRSRLSFSHRQDFLLLIYIHYTHCVMTLLIDKPYIVSLCIRQQILPSCMFVLINWY